MVLVIILSRTCKLLGLKSFVVMLPSNFTLLYIHIIPVQVPAVNGVLCSRPCVFTPSAPFTTDICGCVIASAIDIIDIIDYVYVVYNIYASANWPPRVLY